LGDRRAKIGFGKKGKRQKAKTLGGIFLPRVFIVPLASEHRVLVLVVVLY